MQINTIILLLLNSLLLITLIVVHFTITTTKDHSRKRDYLTSFLLFTITLFLVMYSGIYISDTVKVDSSSLLLGITILYLGHHVGLPLSLLAVLFRFGFGVNIHSILIEIPLVYSIAILFRYLKEKLKLSKGRNRVIFFFIYGVSISIIILLSNFYINLQGDCETFLLVGIYVLFVYPLIMVVLGLILYTLESFIAQTRKLKHLATHDELTGLYNNYYFNQVTKTDEVKNKTLILCNLNDIKDINDHFGFETGNRIISDTADTLRRHLNTDLIFRLSGNDFAIILECDSEKIIDKLEREILSVVNKRVVNGIDYKISIGTSIIDKPTFYQIAENGMLKNKLLNSTGAKNNIIDTIMNVLFEKDPGTKVHSTNVSYYSGLIAEKMGLSYNCVEDAKLAGLLHDIGKIITPHTILNKADKLTDSEFKEMKKHVDTGYRILSSSKQLKDISIYVRCHHERLDGNGYPRQIRDEQIPLISRIISVADSFDAMIGIRPYRDPLTLDEACDELQNHIDSQFDPKVVQIFVDQVVPIIKVD